MGRPYTGADTVYQCPRLELVMLKKAGYFTKGAIVSGKYSWSNGDSIGITTVWNKDDLYMELDYTLTDLSTRQKEKIVQRFDMVTRPSNLGKGSIMYFRCPVSYRLCRNLYRAYHARTFRSRWGFSYSLYYPSQTCGKLSRWDEVHWGAERKLDRLHLKRKTSTYRGIQTKRSKRKERLFEMLERSDEIRWSGMFWPKRLFGALQEMRNP